MGLGLMGKVYNVATGKKSSPAAPEEVKQRVKSTRHRDASDSGGIACKDAATVKDQRSVFSEVIKQIGKNVFAGRDLMYFPPSTPPPPRPLPLPPHGTVFFRLCIIRPFLHVYHISYPGEHGCQHFGAHLPPVVVCAVVPHQGRRI